MYIRKTEDQYSIVSNYADAKQTLKDYRLNQPEFCHKIPKKEKINVKIKYVSWLLYFIRRSYLLVNNDL